MTEIDPLSPEGHRVIYRPWVPPQALPALPHPLIPTQLIAGEDNLLTPEYRFDREADLVVATEEILRGRAVACFNGQVYGLWCNAADPRAVEHILDIKGKERALRPMGLTIPFEDLTALIDTDSLSQAMQAWVKTPGQLTDRLGGIAFVRAIADFEKARARNVPLSVLSQVEGSSRFTIQNFDPQGSPVEPLTDMLREAGVQYIGVTSLNETASREIARYHDHTDESGEFQEGAVSFTSRKGLMLLGAPDAEQPYYGSYPILHMEGTGFRLDRVDALGPEAMQRLLFDCEFSVSPTCKAVRFASATVPEGFFDVQGAALRARILAYAYPERHEAA